MRFKDGYWLNRKGLRIESPRMVHDHRIEGDRLTLYAPSRLIRDRGDELDGPLFTITLDAPLRDVIRVRFVHFAGGVDRGPRFDIIEEPPGARIEKNAESITFTSGDTTAAVALQGPFAVTYSHKGRYLTSHGEKGFSYIRDQAEKTWVSASLELGVGECVYGLGERFTAFVKNGQQVDAWNEDGGTCTWQAYKNVPFYLSSEGYGVFVNDCGRVSYEIGSETVSRVQMSIPGESFELLLIGGESRKAVLERYTALTGRPAVPPAWSFGLWLTTSFPPDYTEQTVTSFLEGMRRRRIPLSVFHFDCFWMRPHEWVSLEWDETTFPHPTEYLRRLKESGLRISLWINPYVAQKSPLFAEGAAKGYFILCDDLSVWQSDLWQPGMAVIDFTNPEARAWFSRLLARLLESGVDAFKADFGERIPSEGVRFWDGSDPARMHNYYASLYNKTVFDCLERARGRGEAVLFSRSATAGSQKFPVHWGGDNSATFASMAESLRGGLSLCLSGFAHWSHDIGGFEGRASAELYKRWAAFGLLSSHSRLHGNSSYRVPWLFDEEAVEVVRKFARLKNTLMPYLFSLAVSAEKTGIPLMRAMMLEFEEEPTALFLDRQYMLGPSLLVAPIFSENGRVSYFLPRGRWTSLLGDAVIEGGSWQSEHHDYLSLPLLARPGSLIPMGADGERADYDYARDLTVHAYEPEAGEVCSSEIYSTDGALAARFELRANARGLVLGHEGSAQPWRMVIHKSGWDGRGTARDGALEPLKGGARFTPARPGDMEFSILYD